MYCALDALPDFAEKLDKTIVYKIWPNLVFMLKFVPSPEGNSLDLRA